MEQGYKKLQRLESRLEMAKSRIAYFKKQADEDTNPYTKRQFLKMAETEWNIYCVLCYISNEKCENLMD